MENLPSEILLQIFDLLDSETLRNVAVVCQRFQSLIHNDNHMMNKILVCINLSNLNISKTSLSDMPYRKFDIFASHYFTRMSLGQFEGRLNSVIEDHYENMENLRLYDSTTGLASKILTNLTNLTHLRLERIQKSGIEEDDAFYSITLPNLKILEVNGVDSYLKCIRCPKVEILKYRNDQSSLANSNPNAVSRSLNNFFKRSHNLKDFTMFGVVPNFETEKFEFKLQKLKFTNYSTNIDETEDSPMVKLLKSQKDNIKDLTVTEYITQNILEIAINEMKNLEKLKLDLDKVFAEPKNLKMNLKLKKFEVINLPNFHHHSLKIIKSCPNVEVLKFTSNIPGFILNEISNSMKNLRLLTLKSANNVTLGQISFNNLKSLTISELSSQDQFESIINICKSSPNLSEMEIRNMSHEMSSKNLDSLIASSRNVEILKLHGNLVYDDYTNMVIFDNNTKLKRIVLDVEVDEYGMDLARMLHDTKVQCIIPDLIRTQRFYTEDRGASNEFLDYESFDESNFDISAEDFELLDSGESASDESCSEIDNSSDFYEENCLSSCSECLDTDTCVSECSEESEESFEDWMVPENYGKCFQPPSSFRNDFRASCSYNNGVEYVNQGNYQQAVQNPDLTQQSSSINNPESSDNLMLHMNSAFRNISDFSNQFEGGEGSGLVSQNYFSKRLRREVEIDESDQNSQNDDNLPSTSKQFGFYNELNNQPKEHEENVKFEDENDADDEEETEDDKKLWINEDSQESEDLSPENQENSPIRPKNQFQIIQVESLYDMSDDNNSNEEQSTSNNLENSNIDENAENCSNSEDHEDDQQDSQIENENSETNSSISEGDIVVEISMQKRSRDSEQGVSSEEDILIEITEGKRKIRKIC